MNIDHIENYSFRVDNFKQYGNIISYISSIKITLFILNRDTPFENKNISQKYPYILIENPRNIITNITNGLNGTTIFIEINRFRYTEPQYYDLNSSESELEIFPKLQYMISLMYKQNPTQFNEFCSNLDEIRPHLSGKMKEFYDEITNLVVNNGENVVLK